jgi:probable metal-binding protein
MSEIHAHKVLNLLRERPMTEQELAQKVEEEFGAEAQFRTCKLNGFSLTELMAFFIKREKIVQVEERWKVNAERVCNH